MLKSLGYIIEEATNDRMAVRLMERDQIDLVLAGVDPGDGEALELLTYVRRKHRDVPVVLLFPRLHPERAKEALRLGAMAVLKYPVPAAELRAAVLQALERCEARTGETTSAVPTGTSPAGPAPASVSAPATIAATAPQAGPAGAKSPALMPMPAAGMMSAVPFQGGAPRMAAGHETMPTVAGVVGPAGGVLAVHTPTPGSAPSHRIDLLVRDLGLIGNDPSWRQVVELAATIASSRSPVLIAGEPGTGKSQLGRLIHAMGLGIDRPFIGCEAAALADELSPDEAERPEGATPAPADSALLWAAKLNLARGGTLFIDDVADLPVALQLHLLRDLQFRDYGAAAGYPPSGGEVRFILSTVESLPALIEQGRFRQELFHRISVIVLTPPPLRHRGTDIELLAEAFRDRYSQEFRKNVAGFTRDALDVLQRHDWPGNVRELEAAIQRAVAMCSGPRISSSHLAPILNHHRQTRGAGGTPRPHLPMGIRPLKEALEEPEKRIIVQALQAFNWNRQETARVLDINRTTLYKKMKKYGLLIDEPMWAQ
jgi:two-component system response regulator HydG